MQILSIIVQFPDKHKVSATTNSINTAKLNQMLDGLPDVMKEKDAYHLLEQNREFYYARTLDKKIMAISLDSALSFKAHRQTLDALFTAINDVTSNEELSAIIQNPNNAIHSKINEIKESTVDIMRVLQVVEGKLVKRGEYIDDLLPKTKELAKQAQNFREGGSDLNDRFKLGCLYVLFKPLKSLLQKAKYTFIPTKQNAQPSIGRR